MKVFATCLALSCAGVLAGCGTTGSVNDGAGYELLTPNAATRAQIVANDVPFAQQIVAHNEQCTQDTLCRK